MFFFGSKAKFRFMASDFQLVSCSYAANESHIIMENIAFHSTN